MCYDMFDEGKSIECGKEMNQLEITGQNEEHKMKLILIIYIYLLQIQIYFKVFLNTTMTEKFINMF